MHACTYRPPPTYYTYVHVLTHTNIHVHVALCAHTHTHTHTHTYCTFTPCFSPMLCLSRLCWLTWRRALWVSWWRGLWGRYLTISSSSLTCQAVETTGILCVCVCVCICLSSPSNQNFYRQNCWLHDEYTCTCRWSWVAWWRKGVTDKHISYM